MKVNVKCIMMAVVTGVLASGMASEPGWPKDVESIRIPGEGGSAEQPALFWRAPGVQKAPLLVGLHTWSSNFAQAGSSLPYLTWCRQEGWHFIHPNFGGPNKTPEGLGSEQAVAEVVRAVKWAQDKAAVDADRIYLVGVSGGGHMAMLMAARHPEIWAGVSAWCGISDIAQWHADCRANPQFGKYASHIEGALGGPPDTEERRQEAARRSPVTWLARARGLPLDIQAGVHDGRRGSVPFLHSLRGFNAVAEAVDRMSEGDMERFYATERAPGAALPEELIYGKWQPLFRKQSGSARVTIFEGGHEIVHVVALNWLAQQRKGQPAVWEIQNPKPLKVGEKAAQSGK
jgi:pimeloyl-ACP methyl ester carboxylesterase